MIDEALSEQGAGQEKSQFPLQCSAETKGARLDQTEDARQNFPGPAEPTAPISIVAPVSKSPLDFALTYARNGWRVIPLHSPVANGCSCGNSECSKPGKHPRIPNWQRDASRDPATVAAWWTKWDANIGLNLEGLAVLDVDVRSGGSESLAALEKEYGPLLSRAVQRTGSGGLHFVFRASEELGTAVGFMPGLDYLTGSGAYIVVEASQHASGGRYAWIESPHPLSASRENICLEPAPRWLLDAVRRSKANGKRKTGERPASRDVRPEDRVPIARILQDALKQAEGRRNDAGLWLFTQLRDNGYSHDEATQVKREWVESVNREYPGGEPYRLGEATETLKQAYKRQPRAPWQKSDDKPSHADTLLSLCDDFEYFKSGPADDAYVRLRNSNHREFWQVDAKSARIRRVLTHRFFEQKGRAPNREGLNTVVETILARCDAGPKVEVYVRFARIKTAIYLDLCDDQWRAVEITRDSWRVVDEYPVFFRRPNGARPLPVPVRGAPLDALRPLLNAGDDQQWI